MWWSLSVLAMVNPRMWCRFVVPWAPCPIKEREAEKCN